MTEKGDAEDTTLLGAGMWTKQGPATLIRRHGAWVVMIPGLRKPVLEAAWTVLGEKPAPEDFLDALVEAAELSDSGALKAILFGFHEGTRAVIGVKGTTPVAVYTAEGSEHIVGTEEEPFVLRTLEGVRRTAFGELPLEDGIGAPRLEAGMVPVRGFVHVSVDPAELGESERAALAEQVEHDGRSIEDPEAKKRRAERAAAKPASPASTPAPSRPVVSARTASSPSVSRPGASAPDGVAPAPAAPNMFEGLFGAGAAPATAQQQPAPSPSPAPPAPTAPVATETTAAAAAPEEPDGPRSSSADGQGPVPARRRLVSSSLFDRRTRSAPASPDPAVQQAPAAAPAAAPAPAVAPTPVSGPAPVAPAARHQASIPTPEPPEDEDTGGASPAWSDDDFVSPITQVAPIDDAEEQIQRPAPLRHRAPAPRAAPAAPAAGDLENTGAYDDLFGKTVFRRIEDAAVRRAAEDEVDEEPAADGQDLDDSTPATAPVSEETSSDAAAAASSAPPQPETQGAPSEFIDWVPGVGRTAPEIAQTAARRATEVSAPAPAYPQVQMAERPPAPNTGSRPLPVPGQSHHPGAGSPPHAPYGGPAPQGAAGHQLGFPEQHRAPAGPQASGGPVGRQGMPQQQTPPPQRTQPQQHLRAPTASSAVMLPGLLCANGHPDAPERSACRTCGAPLQGGTRTVTRPPLGVVLISGGGRFLLDRTAIVGRRPRASRVSGNDVPQLITVPSPQQDISRSHLELRLEGWHVVALDLGTTNGTTLHREGFEPVRLRPREGVVLYDGDHLDLGDDVHLTFGERV